MVRGKTPDSESWLDAFEESANVFEELVDLGNGVMFAAALMRGQPVGSVAQAQLRWTVVIVWSDGMIERFTPYTSIDEAHAADERLAEERR
jgi:hypothetical protein